MTTISTDQAEALLDEGITFLDVRTIEEFDDGHLPDSFNVPISEDTADGRQANPDFLNVVKSGFEQSQKIVVLCRAGTRSANAISMMKEAGYTDLLDMTAGFAGKKDTFGQVILGWQAEGREITTDADEKQRYSHLKKQSEC